MRKLLNLAFLAMLAVGIASCTADEATPDNGAQNAKGTLTINLPITGAAATYVAAEAGESYVDQAIKLYAFDNSTLTLSKIFTTADIIQSTSGTTKKATINVEGLPMNIKFYIVADNGSATAKLNTASAGMTESDFINLATATQSGHLTTPLLLTGNVIVMDAVNAKTVNASVYRSVARFDIDNNVAVTNVEIKAITFSNVNLNGYVFGHAQREAGNKVMTTTAPAVGNLPNITVAPAVANLQSKLSAFYLYPVVLKSAPGVADAKVQIVGAVAGGVEKIYTLKSAADVTIEANKRYKIKAIDTHTFTFTITAEEWEEGEVIDGEATPDGGAAGFIAGSAVAHSGATVDGGNAFAVTPGGSTFEFAVMSSSPTKPIVTVVPNTEIAGWAQLGASAITTTVTTASTITYGAPYYKTTVSVTIPADKVIASESFLSEIKVTDKNGSISSVRVYHENAADAAIYYPGTTLKPVVVGTVTWAPVNVGASVIDVSLTSIPASLGNYYQWGRDLPFFIDNVEFVNGPLSKAEADATKLFIKVSSGHWLSGTDANLPLWTDSKQGPCPEGWMIPDNIELGTLVTAKTSATYRNDAIVFLGDVEGELVIPFAGNLSVVDVETSSIYKRGSQFVLQSRSRNTDKSKVRVLYGTRAGIDVPTSTNNVWSSDSPAIYTGRNIRCIKATI